MGLGAGVLAAAVLATGPAPTQGANLTAYTRDAYRAPIAVRALDQLHETGMRQLAIVVTWYMDDATDSSVAPDPHRTPSDASVASLVREARARGLTVVLKPQVDVRDGTFRGEIAPLDESAWWTSYGAMIRRYAALGETAGAGTMTVGVELASMSDDVAAFERLIAQTREHFSGLLTYAANWDEVEQVGFWETLDAIGVDAYYPLADAPGADVEQLVAAWRPIVERLERLSETADRPLILTELGYPARPLAAVDPSGAGDTPGPYDPEAQAVAYEAALEAWGDSEALAGIYWWDWPADPRDAIGDSYTPRDRPAAGIVRAFATGEEENAGSSLLDRVPWPLLIILAIWTVVALGFLAIVRAAGQAPTVPNTAAWTPPRPRLPGSGRSRPGRTEGPDAIHPPQPAATPAEPPGARTPAAAPPPPGPTPPEPTRAAADCGPAIASAPVVDRRQRFGRRQADPLHELGPVDLDRLAALARDVLDVDMAAVLVRAPDDPLSLITAGEAGVSLRGRRWRADAGVAGMVLTRAEPVAVVDYAQLGARIGGQQTADVQMAAAAPLIVHRALRGTLSIGSRDPERHLHAAELELLGTLAELAAAALARPGGPDDEENVRAQIVGLTAALEAREPDERRRTAALASVVTLVADRLLPPEPAVRAELMLAARLHDVGMLRVPSAPLRQAGPLTPDQRRLVDAHPAWGSDLLCEIPGLQGVAAIVRFHHERWDGSGHPHGLAGTRIPLASRILGAAEAWAAMTVGRPHAPARSPEHAVEELRRQAGRQFDPHVVEVLASVSATVPRRIPRIGSR